MPAPESFLRRRRHFGLLAAAAALLIVVAGVIAPWLHEPEHLQSSWATNPSGFRAFHDAGRALGLPLQRSRRAPAQLDGTGQVLLMLEPFADYFEGRDADLDALAAWVARGNALVVVPETRRLSRTELMRRPLEVETPVTESELVILALAEVFDLPVLWRPPAGLPGQSSRAGTPLSFTGTWPGSPAAPRLHQADAGSFTPDSPRWQTLLQRGEDAVGIEAAHGEGRVVLLAAPDLFRNRHLLDGDHAAFAFTFLAARGPAGILVDEFFHGLPLATSPLVLLAEPPLNLFLLQLALLALAWVWSAAPPFGSAQDPPPPSRRFKAEHLRAVGRLLDNGSAHALAVQRLRDGLLEDLAAALRQPAAGGDELAVALARRAPAAAAELRDLLAAAERAATTHSPRALVAWGRRCHDLRSEILHARRR